MDRAVATDDILRVTSRGLYCPPGDFHIDPARAVDRAIVTHGHGDHARPNNGHVLATPATIAIMRTRYGADAGGALQALPYGQAIQIKNVRVCFAPAGHVLGAAQIVIEHGSGRVVISGDFKRRADPTCPPFEVVPADTFVIEATFGLPVFRHPPDASQIARLLNSLALFPERAHLLGVYGLGKCQRIIALLRQAGYDRPIYLHGALRRLCALYEELGVALGPLPAATEATKRSLAGELVLAPPSALQDRWERRLPDPVRAMASGWMAIRQRARQRNVELPLVISDHADWDELTQTIEDVGAPVVWVTHGREEALVHWARGRGYDARALSLLGREDDAE